MDYAELSNILGNEKRLFRCWEVVALERVTCEGYVNSSGER